MSDPTSKPPVEPPARPGSPGSTTPAPVGAYEKPVIRKYDQIDQVRPYGPSEI